MSITAAIIVLFVAAGVYATSAFLNHSYDHGGRDPINALYSVSQWDPNKWQLTGDCVVPAVPQNCVIEGLTGAYQAATHWCAITDHPCIDPDTGANVQNNPLPIQVSCARVPYCSWSQCILSFSGDGQYVRVNVTGGASPQFSLDNVPPHDSGGDPTLFYMERLSVGKGLVLDQNGTLAKFYLILPGDSKLYILSYVNDITKPSSAGGVTEVTGLTITRTDTTATGYLTIFVLMASMPTTVSSFAAVPGDVVRPKILVFGGANRSTDPGLDVLVEFNDHSQAKLWGAAQKYDLSMIKWTTKYGTQAGFYGDPADTYQNILIGWNNTSGDGNYLIQQDVLESRLAREPGSAIRAFYNWIG